MKIKNQQLKKRFLQQTNGGLTSKCAALKSADLWMFQIEFTRFGMIQK